MQPAPLRFVVLCDSLTFERWQADSIVQAVDAGVAVPVGVVLRDAPAVRAAAGKWRRRWQARDLALWRVFDRFYTRRVSRAVERVDLSHLFAGVPHIRDTPVRQGRFGEALDQATLAAVRALAPDFVLRFSYGILRGEILTLPRHGVWSYHHGDPATHRGQPPGFWELAERSPVAGSILQVLSDELDGGSILRQGTFQTRRSSYAKTRDTLYLGSAPWVRTTCAAILATGQLPRVPPAATKGRIHRQPGNAAMLRFLWTTLRAFVAAQVTYRFFRQDWNCGVVAAPIAEVAGLAGAQRQAQALRGTAWMPHARDAFHADPFGHRTGADGAIRLFFERLAWKTGRGEIATATYADGRFGPVATVLSTATHLSYPFAVAVDGQPGIVPEHAAARDVSRYAVDAHGTVGAATPLFADMPLIDTTFVEWGGRTWAFATMDTATTNTDLFVFHADSLAGPWTAHPLNPVKTDVRSARPGGTPFVAGGRLYRPAQDCATHYGSAVAINEVVTLTETAFEERVVHRVAPLADGGYRYGLHTLSQVGDVTLIDGARKRGVLG